MFSRISIIGLGLMGGSVGLAARARRAADSVCGYARREETRRQAVQMGAVDMAFDNIPAAVEHADLIIVCMPVLSIPSFVEAAAPHLKPGTVVTDVGSTKAAIVEPCTRAVALADSIFIGSHPMCGSDQTGLGASRAHLYHKALVIVTPAADQGHRPEVGALEAFWKTLGADTTILSPQIHDRIIARTSHLPHLAASALVDTVFRVRGESVSRFCGPGFRDTTRVAGSSEEIWHDIFKSNRSAILEELDAYIASLTRARTLLNEGELDALKTWLSHTRETRQEWGQLFRAVRERQ